MNTHTPGPWHVNGRWIENSRHEDIAEIVGAFNDPGEDRLTETGPPNARLIAAAPEMLSALDRFLSCAETAKGATGFNAEYWAGSGLGNLEEIARAAIAKARGE